MIGIFGGTFDPVHHGHLRIALDAQEALALEQVRLLPLHQAVHRDQPVASGPQRLQMLRLALQGHAGLLADDRELRRGGPSYMLDTLTSLQQEMPDKPLCLLLGGDAFNGFPGWQGPREILERANILVMQRPGYALPADTDLQDLVQRHRSRDIGEFKRCPGGQILFHPVTQLEIASSDIRRRIADGLDPSFLLPQAVIEYIEQEGLYRQPG